MRASLAKCQCTKQYRLPVLCSNIQEAHAEYTVDSLALSVSVSDVSGVTALGILLAPTIRWKRASIYVVDTSVPTDRNEQCFGFPTLY